MTSGEDALVLEGFKALGLPVTTRAETGRIITVLHVQHGKNVGHSFCHVGRADTKAIKTQIDRFELACRRILRIPQAEYDQMGDSLLYPGLHCVALSSEAPAVAKGL